MSTQGELNKIIREYRAAGWKIDKTKSGHWRWTPPWTTRFFFTGGTTGNNGAIKAVMAQIKRAEKGRGGRSDGTCDAGMPSRSSTR